METYKYGAVSRIAYRYGNIIATLLLSIHLISSIIITFEQWYFIFFVLLNALFIFIINKYFIRTYKIFPFKVEADNEKIICSDFFFSKKIIEIKYEEITKITGGIFSGYPTRPIYIFYGENNSKFGFYSHVGRFQKLLTKILQNIPQNLYNNLVDTLKHSQTKEK